MKIGPGTRRHRPVGPDVPHPAVRISVTLADGTTTEVVAALPSQESGTFSVTVPDGAPRRM